MHWSVSQHSLHAQAPGEADKETVRAERRAAAERGHSTTEKCGCAWGTVGGEEPMLAWEVPISPWADLCPRER